MGARLVVNNDRASPGDWRAALAVAYRHGRKRGEPVADLSEMASSPEGMMAIGLTAALVRLCTTAGEQRLVAEAASRGDIVAERDNGPGLPDVLGRPHSLFSPAWQRHLLHRYCAWRTGALGLDPIFGPPRDLGELDVRLVACANAASPSELAGLADDIGETPAMQRARVGELKAIGAGLLRERPSLALPRPGPADGAGLPRRSWQPEPPSDTTARAAEPATPTL